jgi:hypothetical protein
MQRQAAVFAALLGAYALLVFVAYAFIPPSQLFLPTQALPARTEGISPWLLGLAGAGGVLAIYGPLGLLGAWFARKLQLPGMFREDAAPLQRYGWPALLGVGLGFALVGIDRVFVASGSPLRIPHPEFPLSLIASGCAALGEEMIFRLFAMGLVAVLLRRIQRFRDSRRGTLWGGNAVAALLFSAGHLPAAMVFLGVASLAAIPASVWAEILLLNAAVGLVAGEQYARQGLVAAIGVHFWTDMVWHVLWPLIG